MICCVRSCGRVFQLHLLSFSPSFSSQAWKALGASGTLEDTQDLVHSCLLRRTEEEGRRQTTYRLSFLTLVSL